MTEKDLNAQCSTLAYSICDELTEEIFNATISALKILYPKYGYANVLGELSKLWPIEKAIPFFSKANLQTNRNCEIKTIATYCHRAYNGGVERVQAQLMSLWAQMGYQVILFTEEPANELDYPYPSTIKRIIIPPLQADKIPDRLGALQKHCTENHVDLYVNHVWSNVSALWECMLLKMMHIPFVQYIHGHFACSIWNGKCALFQPELFNLCDIVLSLSETNARFYQLCGCNSYMVHNPVPEDLSSNKEIASLNSNHILMVGRLSAEKRPMDAIKIFKLVHEQLPDIILDVVGGDDANFIPQMQKYINNNHLQNNVIFHGKKVQTEIAEFYKKSACVLFTSEMEGYPMVILESKAYGLPLVMYDLPYLSLVKDGKGILTSQIGDIAAMSKHLIKLLTNDSYKADLGKAARESFESFNAYNLEKTWSNIIALCSHEKDTIDDPAYFNPKTVSYADKFIEPMLLDAMKGGFDYILESNFDYQIGKKALKYPRKIKSLLRKMKGSVNHGK